ncbi:MAG: ROK family glucokinase [Micrococcales bacterium]
MHAIGIDIGGTKIAGGLVDEDGNIVRESRVATPTGSADEIVSAVVNLIRDLSADHKVLGAGVAFAGFIDANQAEVLYAPNLSFRNEPFKAKLEAQLDIPVLLENDANAAGWAEYRYGAGRGCKHMVMLTIGTGVGGAVISNSRMLRGGFGIAGELGHIRVVPEGRPCGCGARGCIEQYGSGTALLRSAIGLADSAGSAGERLRQLRAEHGGLKGEQVYQAIIEGDHGALGLLSELGSWLGQTIATLSAVLDPEIVVIGGGVSAAGDLLLQPIREAYLANMPAHGFRPELQIRTAEFVNDAGVVGAADLVRLAWSQR